MDSRIKYIFAGVLLAASAGFLYVRWRPPAPAPDPRAGPTFEQVVEQSQKAMARFGARPLEQFATSERVQEWFSRQLADAEIDDGPQSVPPKPGEVEAVVAVSAEFFCYRFCQPEAQVYIDWRARKGYRFRSDESMEKLWQIRRDAATMLGRPIRSDETLEDLYREMWKFATGAETFNGSGRIRPIEILEGAGSFRVQFFEIDHPYAHGVDFTPAGDVDIWDGERGFMLRRWWTWPFSLDDRLKQQGKLRGARVGWIVEDEDRARCAMVAVWLWDAQARRWWLWEMMRGIGPTSTNHVLEI